MRRSQCIEPHRECRPARRVPTLFAQLDQPQAAIERRDCASEERFLAQIAGTADPVDGGQRQRGEHARVGGQQRRYVDRFRILPRERLPVAASGLAIPCDNAEEIDLDVGVRIDELLGKPGRRATHDDAQFLVQFAR